MMMKVVHSIKNKHCLPVMPIKRVITSSWSVPSCWASIARLAIGDNQLVQKCQQTELVQ